MSPSLQEKKQMFLTGIEPKPSKHFQECFGRYLRHDSVAGGNITNCKKEKSWYEMKGILQHTCDPWLERPCILAHICPPRSDRSACRPSVSWWRRVSRQLWPEALCSPTFCWWVSGWRMSGTTPLCPLHTAKHTQCSSVYDYGWSHLSLAIWSMELMQHEDNQGRSEISLYCVKASLVTLT